ncbi:MAG: 3-dehydroquinate synthase [Verrucomicrobia bacterium]|nr:3-dehydroquinate synthase [Verrucomicrobiota bacterium]
MEAAPIYHQHISVHWEFPVVFTRNLFAPENPILAQTADRLGEKRRHRAVVYVDSRILERDSSLRHRIQTYFDAHSAVFNLAAEVQSVPGGEACKNELRYAESVMRQLLELRMDRQSFVLAVGGGALLDAIGFAAALVHRGLRLIRVPTTVLAQNDAGVGVKNAVNYHGKNALGTFAPPFAVINDFEFLRSLPDRDWLSGVAEAFKVAIIRDRVFFDALCKAAPRYPARDFEAMTALVARCATLHLDHIRSNGDPFEYGTARPLDFGHWSAHKLELLSNFRVSHGEAVATGVLLDSIYACSQGWISAAELERIDTGLRQSGFALWFDELNLRDTSGSRMIFAGLRDFQEHLGGELCVTFPQGIGARFEVNTICLDAMESALVDLERRWARSALSARTDA